MCASIHINTNIYRIKVQKQDQICTNKDHSTIVLVLLKIKHDRYINVNSLEGMFAPIIVWYLSFSC